MTDTAVADTPADETKVDAEPTKDFFISMLTRDIDLKDAVVDLVDNSVDGARRMRPNQEFSGLKISLEFTESSFVITDNCGGMSVDVARRYAFRFGRDKSEQQRQARSIGQFGVGMKRTLFKMGSHFKVASQTTEERFVLDVEVDEWRRTPDWDFRFSELDRSTRRPEEEAGTTIEVRPLHDEIGVLVVDEEWLAALEDDLRLKHGQSIRNGISISLAGDEIAVEPLELLTSNGLRPAVRHDSFAPPAAGDQGDSDKHGGDTASDHAPVDGTVEVKLVAGVGARDRQYAGWYVYCNGRLVLGPDRTRSTVWGMRTPARVPIYHDQFARFRGYAFFESDDPSRLPWTTTKTGVDADNAIWKSARAEMISMTRPVIDFLNMLDKQNTAAGGAEAAAAAEPWPDPEGPETTEPKAEYAERTLVQAERTSVFEIAQEVASFQSPEIDSADLAEAPLRISYLRERTEVEAVRERLGPSEDGAMRTNTELGEETWEYFWRNEVER